MSAYWSGYSYPEGDPKVHIGFDEREGKTAIWISDIQSQKDPETQLNTIRVYELVLIEKTDENSAREFADDRARAIIADKGL